MRLGETMRMKTKFMAAAALAALMIVPAAAQTPSRPPSVATQAVGATALSGAARDAAIARANAALNAQRTLQGRFVQAAADGSRARGAFYLQRPGKLRFEYDAPATMLIVSDGRVVHMRDRALRTTERTPLDSTPLRLILSERIDLARDGRITRVARQGDALLITARDRAGVADGEITLRFEGPNARLTAWDVVDAAGGRTQIALTDITTPASLDRRLFQMEDRLEARPGRP